MTNWEYRDWSDSKAERIGLIVLAVLFVLCLAYSCVEILPWAPVGG